MKYLDLVNKYPIISLQINRASLSLVLRELETVLEQGIAGDIAEFGCYSGTTSLFIRRVLDARQETGRTFYAYDSFAGLPEKTSADNSTLGTQFKGGELAVSKKEFRRNFQRAGLRPPITTKLGSAICNLNNYQIRWPMLFWMGISISLFWIRWSWSGHDSAAAVSSLSMIINAWNCRE